MFVVLRQKAWVELPLAAFTIGSGKHYIKREMICEGGDFKAEYQLLGLDKLLWKIQGTHTFNEKREEKPEFCFGNCSNYTFFIVMINQATL